MENNGGRKTVLADGGASKRDRTADPLLKRQLLCLLSYTRRCGRHRVLTMPPEKRKEGGVYGHINVAVVCPVGLEPTRLAAAVFETALSTVSKHGHIWSGRWDSNPQTQGLNLLPMPIRLCPDVAPEVGFEPTVSFPTPVFKTGSLNRSDTLAYKKGGNAAALVNVYCILCCIIYFQLATAQPGGSPVAA